MQHAHAVSALGNTELLVRANGIQPAFGIEFGLASPRADEVRAADPYRQANASYSILQRQGARIVRHTLVDVGMGVVPSLLDLEASHDVHVVHEVFLTHAHYDHFAQLDWLSVALMRNGRQDQPRPLPVYATRACWHRGPNAVFPHLAERTEFRPIEPGQAVRLDSVAVTPFAVEHSPSAPGSVGFVIQHGGRKVIITGDFARVPGEDAPLFRDADICFMEANTWHPIDGLDHQSVLGNLRLIEKWNPRRVYFIHYSGFEDREFGDDPINGPMALSQLEAELRQLNHPVDLQVATHGMILGETAPWP